MSGDTATAEAFATSWNNLPGGSVYTRAQVQEWFAPLTESDFRDKTVLELGCGNASLLVHVASWKPARVEGVDLGASVLAAEKNRRGAGHENYTITRADLTSFRSHGFGRVYSIGVLHHLKSPNSGFESVIANVRPGGRFHCWVYAREGNGIIIWLVDPLRKITSHLPWWVTKYLIATPLVLPYYFYAKALRWLRHLPWLRKAPLYDYSLWIAQRDYAFFRHVAFDQLVTPQTSYLDKTPVEEWLHHSKIAADSTYLIFRNGNSWKFGGTVRSDAIAFG